MKNAFIRMAKAGDERGIHDAHMQSIRELCSKDYSAEQINAWGGREFNYAGKKSLIQQQHVWVVECDGVIQGYGLLFINQEKSLAEIGGLYLTAKVVGLGLGKQIISEMKLKAKQLGFTVLHLSSTITSKEFYQKQGAQQVGEDQLVSINGMPIECHPMQIQLVD